MGFQVEVKQVVQHVAVCCEMGCNWVGPQRSMHGLAEEDATQHIKLHYDWWQKYNDAIELMDKEGDFESIIEYYDDLTYPAVPRSSHPSTSDRPRFDYSRLDRELVGEVDEG